MALYFNGASRLRAGGADSLGVPLTFAAWVRPANNVDRFPVSLGDTAETQQAGMMLHKTQGVAVTIVRVGNNWHRADGQPWTTDEWQHLTGICYADGSMGIFQNGIQTGASQPATMPSNLTVLSIGARPNGSHPMLGSLAEVAVWSKPLSEGSIRQLAAGISPLALTQDAASLVAYQDLVRDLNRPGVGPTATLIGGITPQPHPAVFNPASCVYTPAPLRRFPRLAAAQQTAAGDVGVQFAVPGAAKAVCRAA